MQQLRDVFVLCGEMHTRERRGTAGKATQAGPSKGKCVTMRPETFIPTGESLV